MKNVLFNNFSKNLINDTPKFKLDFQRYFPKYQLQEGFFLGQPVNIYFFERTVLTLPIIK